MSESSNQAQRDYKARHNCMGKVIQLDMSKILKEDHTPKWYMHKPESAQKNETHKILWDFKIQTDLLFPTRNQI